MKKYFYSLQGLRVLFFSNIFLYHILGILDKREILFGFFEGGGRFGVSGFLTLSGFLIASAFEKPKNFCFGKSVIDRLINFFKKYYGVHLIFLVVMAPFEILKVINGDISTAEFLLCLFSQLTLTQSFLPIEGMALSFNDVGWYLSTMLLISIASIGIAVIFNRFSKRILIYSLIACIIAEFLFSTVFYYSGINNVFQSWFLYYSPFARCLDFSIGIIYGLLFKYDYIKIKKPNLILLILLGFIFIIQIFFNTIPIQFSYSAIYSPFVGLLIYILANEKNVISKVLKTPFLVHIGDISMYLYISHFAVGKYLFLVYKRLPVLINENFMATLFVILSVVITYYVAIIVKSIDLKIRSRKYEKFSCFGRYRRG